jgi:cellobiose phosphorylase
MNNWYFSEDNNEFTIRSPYTPRPWINYLTNGRYFALTSQTGGGFSFFMDPLHHAITRREQDLILNDRPGRFVFIQDLKDGTYWNIGGNPSPTPLEDFTCRHGFGYTIIDSQYRKIQTIQEIIVLQDADAEVWYLRFQNMGTQLRHLRVFAYIEWLLGTCAVDPIARTFDTFFKHVSVDRGVIIGRKLKWGLRGHRENKPWEYEAFATSTRPADRIWLDRFEFIGPYREISRPIALENRLLKPIHPSEVWATDVIGTQEWSFELAPGEVMEWEILVGIGQKGEAMELSLSLSNSETLQFSREKIKDHWRKRVHRIQIDTPNKEINQLNSGWTPYQIIIKSYLSSAPSYYHASDGSPGFRDAMQDAFGLCILEPKRARELILRLTSFQYKDGTVSHRATRLPIPPERSEKSDLPLWIPLAVLQYVKETGDLSIILEDVPYADGLHAPLIEHILAGLERSMKDTGNHGLPLIHYGDWNDALDGLGGKGRGESVFLGEFLAFALRNSSTLAELIGEHGLSQSWFQKSEDLIKIINKDCWDEDRFVRAFHDDGTIIGCRNNREGSLYLNPQVWAVIGNLALRERLEICMNTVESELSTPFGIRCLAPPYTQYDSHVGLISCFPPSIKENGAIFSHAMAFCILAELMLRRAEEAWDILCKANPVSRGREHPEYSMEPYIYSQFVAGPETNLNGQGFHHWLTSTCSWMQYIVTNWMLGARADLDGLAIDPCIPSNWREYKMKRPFRGSIVNINVKNPLRRNYGVKELRVNGKSVSGNTVFIPRKECVELEAVLG